MSDSENEEESVVKRHKKEKKELQAKIQQLKHSVSKGDKKKKKEITEQITKLESELNDKHATQLKELKDKSTQEVTDRLSSLETNDTEVDKKTGDGDVETQEDSKEKKVSKAMKRREKQATKNKEREERIKEQELLNLTGARHIEFERIKSLLKTKNLQIFEIPSDGNCLYTAISHQVPNETYETLRRKTAQYMRENPDEFLPFLTKENGDSYNEDDFETFLQKTAETAEWGGQLEVKAMSSALHHPIEIIQGEGPQIKIGEEFGAESLTVCYHRHAFGLGEHYNSVETYVPEEEAFS
ncbi:deubiquitinase OTUD6B-like [Mytilus californianus]|uniref:deubiquitinase OTUD6B-like n=1 Tax=Mytilus californianus TaxID=6549 RepID=UPI002246EFEE|nr:deubiquitinase OTUD6B-like [Mytilus californianus]